MTKIIRKFDDPCLSTPCSDLDFKNEDMSFIKIMKEALIMSLSGVGIAASQIGVLKNVIVVRPYGNIMETMINPKIISHSEEVTEGIEGCLSYPGVFGNVQRFARITVSFINFKFKEQVSEFSNFPAIVIQHEVDHNLGICKVGDIWRKQQIK